MSVLDKIMELLIWGFANEALKSRNKINTKQFSYKETRPCQTNFKSFLQDYNSG